MAHITREDGEHFVVPSYRDILSAKNPTLLKKEIMLLSANYGDFITLLRKNQDQYEATFSSEPGYLLGESIWNYFKRPLDLIYCEAIPGTTDALLVIVKGSSVYLDGSFPIDSIPDELVVFKSQPGNFEIFIHGDIPISQQPEDGKFFLNASSVKSFTELAEPLFPTLPKYNEYKLTQAETLLTSMGIGVIPLKKIAIILAIPAFLVVAFVFFSAHREEAPKFIVSSVTSTPWDSYFRAINASPAPEDEVHSLLQEIIVLFTAPGWIPTDLKYTQGTLNASLTSPGMKIAPLLAWAKKNNITLDISSEGMKLTATVTTQPRAPMHFYADLNQITSSIIDRLSTVSTGITIAIGDPAKSGPYSTLPISITFNDSSIESLNILANQFKNLPVIFSDAAITVNETNGNLSGKLVIQALGV